MPSRRDIVLAGAGLAMGWPMPMFAADSEHVDLKLGLQLWTVKDDIKRDFEGTLRRIAAIGFRRVELFETGGRPAAQIRDAIRTAGLECISAHVRLSELEGEFSSLVERAHQIGLNTLIVPTPWMPPEMLERAQHGDYGKVLSEEMTLDYWRKTAEQLNLHAERLHKSGLALAYHNHSSEFRRFDGIVAYDALVEALDPGLVRLELDCGWVVSAGADCLTLLKRWPRRFMALHIKDVKAGFVPNFAVRMDPTEVGSGVVDWLPILQTAYTNGVREFYIEQEEPFAHPPLDAVKIGFDYLSGISRKLKAG
jgi:sugar phosphate isomerase/epimerase